MSKIQRVDVDVPIYIDRISFTDFDVEAFRETLLLMDELGASDAYISSNKKIDFKIKKEVFSVSSSYVELNCLEMLITDIYRGDTLLSIKDGNACDTSYLMNYNVPKEIGFRVHITSTGSGTGLLMVLRRIPESPPHYKTIGIPQELVDVQLALRAGIGFVCGVTNSGKSTTIASLNMEVLASKRVNILTYEHPIEYTFNFAQRRLGRINQFQIGLDVDSFEEAASNCLRCSPDCIFIGETRNAETCSPLLQYSETGHNIITTMHIGRIHLILERIASFYPTEHYANIISRVIDQLNFVVVQALVKGVDGKLLAVREVLILDNEMKRGLHASPINDITTVLEDLVVQRGTPMYVDSMRLYDEGLICKDTHNKLCESIGEVVHEVQ